MTSVVHSQILYGTSLWAPLLHQRAGGTVPIKNAAKNIKSAQRLMALMVARAYRTTSFEAATLIASIPPITLLATKRAAMRNATDKVRAAKDARKILMSSWQSDWDNTENGRWTHKLIKDVAKWFDRRHGDINHFLTQILCNHGCFNAYLYRMKKLSSPKCSLCHAEIDDANHTLFECDAFENWRMT